MVGVVGGHNIVGEILLPFTWSVKAGSSLYQLVLLSP